MKWVLHTWFELTEDKGNGNSVKLGPEKDGYQRRSCRFDFALAGLYRDSGKIKWTKHLTSHLLDFEDPC